MNSLWVVVVGVVVITLAYRLYAKRIDRVVIEADADRATPATLYMDGVDFVPTSRFVLYGYHFKSIAAAGPIVGVITATNLWGWLPAIIWLMVGVSFIGWASDYTAIMMAVRNDGNSMSAVAHRLLAPRARSILFVFIFFYLLLIGGAFVGIMAAILDARPDVPFGILMLALMGVLAGYLIYRRRADLLTVTAVVVGVTIAAMALGPVGADLDTAPVAWSEGAISGVVTDINDGINDRFNGDEALYGVEDPTFADPRIPAPVDGVRPSNQNFDAETGTINVFPSFVFWAIALLVFSYLGANLPIWRFAQPVNYIGFWITALVIVIAGIGAVKAPFTDSEVANFEVGRYTAFAPDQASGAIQPLWPMLFVTIACGAISGWHALFGSVGTSRQLEYETDALPVGGGGMFSENTLALLSLTAVAIVGGGIAGAGAFAAGVGNLLNVASFDLIDVTYGTALGFGTFVVIVLTVVQLVFRVMRVTLGEWLGGTWVGFKNQHIASIIGSAAVLLLVMSGTWVYLWQLFGASNQLLAALSLLLVTIWLVETGRNPAFAGVPMVFMYVTTIAASGVTAWNLYQTIATADDVATISVIGAWLMIAVAILLVVAALVIGYDGWQAWQRQRPAGGAPAVADAEPKPAPTT
jgi:carbon starvation protein